MNMDLARKGIDDEDFGDGQREIAEFLFNRVRELEAALRELWTASEGCSDREIEARINARTALLNREGQSDASASRDDVPPPGVKGLGA